MTRRSGSLALVVAAAGALAVARPARAEAERIIVMPFEEGGKLRAADRMTELVVRLLARRGYDVVLGDVLERFFERERIRYMDSVPAPVMTRMLEEFGATRVLFGSVLAASERPLLLSASARMVGSGAHLLWTDAVTLAPENASGLLDAAHVADFPELLDRVTRALVDRMPAGGQRPDPPPPRVGAPAPSPRPVSYRRKGFDAPAEIVILPPTNYTFEGRTPRLVTDLLARRVGDHERVRVVEAGDLRNAAVGASLRLSRRLDVEDMKQLSQRLGANLFLRTSILRFEPGLGEGVSTNGRITLEMTLVDAATERIVWTAYHDRSADEYVAPFKRSPVRNVVTLADQAIAEMVQTLWR